jgi:hypothetical protein
MAKFKNDATGDVIETEAPAGINDYRQREGWTEVEDGKKSSSTSSQKSSS